MLFKDDTEIRRMTRVDLSNAKNQHVLQLSPTSSMQRQKKKKKKKKGDTGGQERQRLCQACPKRKPPTAGAMPRPIGCIAERANLCFGCLNERATAQHRERCAYSTLCVVCRKPHASCLLALRSEAGHRVTTSPGRKNIQWQH